MKTNIRRVAPALLTAMAGTWAAGCGSTEIASTTADKIVPQLTVSLSGTVGSGGVDSVSVRTPLAVSIDAQDNSALQWVVTRVYADTFLVGRALYEVGEIEKSRPFIEEAARLDPAHVDAHYYVGLLRDEAGDARGAVEAFLRSRSIDASKAPPVWAPSPEGFSVVVRKVRAGLDVILSRYVREAEVYVVDLPGAELVVDGVDLAGLDEDGLALFRRDRVGILFQSFHLIPTMTALENVALPLELAGARARDAFAAAGRHLREVGLAERAAHYPGQLSGGEQQRVAIARAIVKRPEVLLCDEPTGALDYVTGKLVLEVIERVNQELGTTAIVITHNAAIAGMADRVLYLGGGRIQRIEQNAHKCKPSELSW